MVPDTTTNTATQERDPGQVPEGDLRDALSGVEFPAGKEDLVERAKERNVDEATLEAIRLLPQGDFEAFDEVMEAFREVREEREDRMEANAERGKRDVLDRIEGKEEEGQGTDEERAED